MTEATTLEPVTALYERVDTESIREACESSQPSLNSRADNSDKQVDAQLPFAEVTSSNGISLKCSYLDHPGFDPASNLCITIHYLVVKLSPSRVAGWTQTLFTALKYLFDFLVIYNSGREIRITHFLDITPSVFKSYMTHLRKEGKTQAYAFRIKSLLVMGSAETELVPKIELPAVTMDQSVPSEPLYEDGLATLTACTKNVVDAIRMKIENRRFIEEAEPYTLEELNDLHDTRISDEDLFGWYKVRLLKKLRTDRLQIFAKINHAKNPEARALPNNKNLKKAFHELYERIGSALEIPEKFLRAEPVRRKSLHWSLILDPYRVTKTFIMHDFPFAYSSEELRKEYNTLSMGREENRDNVIKVLAHKLSAVRTFQEQHNVPTSMSMDEHMALYFPTADDLVGLALFMMLQAGWNKETVLDIDKDNFEHALTSTVEERIKIVWSEKFRSQGLHLPYDAPKQMLARTDSEDPYSLYNLILLAKDLTAPISRYVQGRTDPFKNRPVNSLFAYVRSWSAWSSYTPLGTLDFQTAFGREVKSFLAQHTVIDNGIRLKSAESLTRRLRATWVYYNAENTPFAFLSQLLGHNSRDTTDEHYDNSSLARSRRYTRLRDALEHVIELVRARKFSGLLSKEQPASSKPKLTAFTLPYFDRVLWACSDRKNPDWAGAPALQAEELCSALEKCIFCSQIWILKDSLPYLLERISHIDDLMRDHRMSDFGSELEAEHKAISSIFDRWNDQSAVKDAIRYRAANAPLLPREMRDLQLIFRTGELDA